MKVPLILKEVESRTEDINEKIVISQILEIEEKSIRKLFLFFLNETNRKKKSLSIETFIFNFPFFFSFPLLFQANSMIK